MVENKYQTINTISKWICKCLKDAEKGQLKYHYLESEIYGCCEKNIAEGDEETGTEKPEFTEKKRRKNKKKDREQVYVIRLSTNVRIPKEGKKTLENGKYIILSKKDLKGLRSEHIYPRNLLFKEIIEMKDPSVENIEDLIKDRCKVAYITKEEEQLLDKKITKETLEKLKKNNPEVFEKFKIEVGDILKDEMPEEWNAGNPVDMRLEARGIILDTQLYLVADI